MLYTLAARRGSVVSYREIAAALGAGPAARTNSLARHVSTIRRKLGDDAQRPRYIQTIPAIGYQFIAEGE